MKYPIRKRWGQNFLKDNNIQQKIVDLLNLNNNDHVLEIGPGYGALTQFLSYKVKNLTAIEIDPLLSKELKKINFPNTNIINEDFLQTDLNSFNKNIKCIGNLPYYITTPILFKILKWNRWSKCVFMVQKEVAIRLTAKPGNKNYGRLTIMAGLFGEIKFEFNVSSNVFIPKPGVDSAIISISPNSKYNFPPEFINSFENIVKLAFSARRKVLKNTIYNFLNDKIIKNYGKRRPEECSIDDFITIVNAWYSNN